MSTNSEAIFVAETKSKMSKEKTLEDNIRIAFNEVKNHWLISQYNDERKEFDAAMLAVSSFYGIDSPEFARIKQEMVYVRALFHTPSNVPIDWNRLLDEADKDFKPIGVTKIWKEVRNDPN